MIDLVDEIRKQRYLEKDYNKVEDVKDLIRNFTIFDGEISEKDIIYKLQEYDLDVNNFYYCNSEFKSMLDCSLVYVSNFIYTLNPILREAEDINKTFELLKEKEKNYSYTKKFITIPSTLRLDNLLKYHNNIINKNELKDIIIDTYISIDNDYVFIKEILFNNFKKGNENNLRDLNNNDDILTIYRGVHSNSLSLEESFSWTLSYDVALKFANRRKYNGEVYKAKIKRKDVYLYINNRGEEEVIIKYEDLIDINKVY